MSLLHTFPNSVQGWQERIDAYESPLLARVRTIAKATMMAHKQSSGLVLYGEAVREIAAGRRPEEHSFAFYGLDLSQVVKLLHFYFPELLIVHDQADCALISAKMAKREALVFAVPRCDLSEFVAKRLTFDINRGIYDLGCHTLSIPDGVFVQLESNQCGVSNNAALTTKGFFEGLKIVARHGLKFSDSIITGSDKTLFDLSSEAWRGQSITSLSDALGCGYCPGEYLAAIDGIKLTEVMFPELSFLSNENRRWGLELISRFRQKCLSASIGLREEQYCAIALALLFAFSRMEIKEERILKRLHDWNTPVTSILERLNMPSRVGAGVQSAVSCTDQLLSIIQNAPRAKEGSQPAPTSPSVRSGGAGIGRGGFVARSTVQTRYDRGIANRPVSELINESIKAAPSFSPAMAALLIDTLLDTSVNFPVSKKAQIVLQASEEQRTNPVQHQTPDRKPEVHRPQQHQHKPSGKTNDHKSKEAAPTRGSNTDEPNRPGMGPRLNLKKR